MGSSLNSILFTDPLHALKKIDCIRLLTDLYFTRLLYSYVLLLPDILQLTRRETDAPTARSSLCPWECGEYGLSLRKSDPR